MCCTRPKRSVYSQWDHGAVTVNGTGTGTGTDTDTDTGTGMGNFEPHNDLALTQELYDSLREIAASRMRQERHDGILQTTMVVHEAYLRLRRQSKPWASRAEFCAAASSTMRRVLVDYARRKSATKREGARSRADLSDAVLAIDDQRWQALELHDALEALAAFAPDQARALELMYFGGLTGDEIAQALETSPGTVDRRLRTAKAWLRRELGRDVDVDQVP